MIAFNVSEGIRKEFTAFLPGLAERLSCRFRHRKAEARDEAIAEGIAHAWVLFLSASQRGKSVTPGTLAHFAGALVESGRKVAGNSTIDALADVRHHGGRHVSLDSPGLSHATFYTTFGDRRWRWPVVDYVAPQVDFEAFLSHCSLREQRIIEMKLDGWPQTDIAAVLGVTPAAVCQRLRGLRRRWEATSAA